MYEQQNRSVKEVLDYYDYVFSTKNDKVGFLNGMDIGYVSFEIRKVPELKLGGC